VAGAGLVVVSAARRCVALAWPPLGAIAFAAFVACPRPAACQPAAGPPDGDGFPTLKATHTARECAVWQRELSFARSVERHDAVAFAGHVHPGAVFNAGDVGADRGRDAVVRSWADIVEGQRLVLRWRPGVVQIGGDPDIALSRGPFILEDPNADPAMRYRVGQFQSVWVRDRTSGVWRVLYDAGAVPPRAVESLEAARRYLAAHSPLDCAPG
jgi:ketosteroid isomerase-like protein